MKIIKFKGTIDKEQLAVDFIAEKTGLSKVLIKKVFLFGGFWIQKKGHGKILRQRKAKSLLSLGDIVQFNYDPKLINQDFPVAVPLEIRENKNLGLWYKPPGLLSQGSPFGDKGSLQRQVELVRKNTFLINRLDREASGIVIFGHNKNAAGELSKIWGSGDVKKFYQAIVLGIMEEDKGEITLKLDGKECMTKYHVHKRMDNKTALLIELVTGRYHQIRRHFDLIGHPVMGDPKYGRGNKNEEGLQLVADKIRFKDPIKKKIICYELPEQYLLFT